MNQFVATYGALIAAQARTPAQELRQQVETWLPGDTAPTKVWVPYRQPNTLEG